MTDRSEHQYFLVWKSEEGSIHSSAWRFHGYMEACAPPHPHSHCLPGMLNTQLNWAAVRTVFPLKHLSTTIMFVLFVSHWLSIGPALRCFPGNTSLHCQLSVNAVHPARVEKQLMESVVLFLLI